MILFQARAHLIGDFSLSYIHVFIHCRNAIICICLSNIIRFLVFTLKVLCVSSFFEVEFVFAWFLLTYFERGFIFSEECYVILHEGNVSRINATEGRKQRIISSRATPAFDQSLLSLFNDGHYCYYELTAICLTTQPTLCFIIRNSYRACKILYLQPSFTIQ